MVYRGRRFVVHLTTAELERVASRAKHYGLDSQDYARRALKGTLPSLQHREPYRPLAQRLKDEKQR